MTIWNVKPDTVEQTTLAVESVERRWSIGRGYCVEARSAAEARVIVRDYTFGQRGYPISERGRVRLVERQRVPVLSRGEG
jgi:hypothetical protein